MKALPAPQTPQRGVEDLRLLILTLFVCVVSGTILGNVFVTHRDLAHLEDTLQMHTYTQPSVFADLELEAEAVYVWDMTTDEVLFAQNDDNVFPLASITKVATALTAARVVPDDVVVRLGAESIAIQGDHGLRVDEQWTLEDITDFMLVTSSNDGAHSIASVGGKLLDPMSGVGTTTETSSVDVFVDAMNTTAREIGLSKTRFYNPSGLDVDSGQSGGYGTARDVAHLVGYALQYHPDIIQATRLSTMRTQSLDGIAHDATNTNPLVDTIPGILASKTGYTELAGGNLVIAYDPFPGRPIIIAVLGSTFEGRFNDMEKLTQATLAHIQRN